MDSQNPSITSLVNTNWKMLNKEIREKMKIEFLHEAMRTREKFLLEKAIEVAKEQPSPVPQDEPCLVDAETELQIVNLKQELQDAQKLHDVGKIRDAIERIPPTERYMCRLQQDVALANSDIARYERMAQLRKSILDMDMKTMSEMRRYHNPPVMIHNVMRAVMLLFGEHEETTQDWRVVQKALNPHGQHGMNRRILSFDSSTVHPAICARVRELLIGLDLDKLQAVSRGAGTFYVWAMGIVEIVETQRGTELPANVWRQKEIFGCLHPNPNASPRNKRKCQHHAIWKK